MVKPQGRLPEVIGDSKTSGFFLDYFPAFLRTGLTVSFTTAS
jgi:hypothetical protein